MNFNFDFLQKYTNRERFILAIGAGTTLLYLLYTFIYAPLTTAVTHAIVELEEQKNTLAWMRIIRTQRPNASHQELIDSNKLLSVFSTALKKTTFTQFPYALQQTNAGEIQLSFEEVPFNAFITWLKTFSTQYALRITTLNAFPTETKGLTKLSITLSLKPAA
jgi:general secretion pathway protein M